MKVLGFFDSFDGSVDFSSFLIYPYQTIKKELSLKIDALRAVLLRNLSKFKGV